MFDSKSKSSSGVNQEELFESSSYMPRSPRSRFTKLLEHVDELQTYQDNRCGSLTSISGIHLKPTDLDLGSDATAKEYKQAYLKNI